MEKQKQCVSVRLSNSDIQKIKRIAGRLKISDSDLIRFAIRGILSRLAPLSDERTSGSELLPVFIEYWNEIAGYFDFDTDRLEAILNTGSDDRTRVQREDIELLAMHNTLPTYMKMRLEKTLGEPVSDQTVAARLSSYLYEKYGHGLPHKSDQPESGTQPADNTVN
jgi:hypothetical protein